MRGRRFPSAVLGSLAACALFSLTGCGRIGSSVVHNELPTLVITSGPVDTSSTPSSWLVDITWSANDPDGSIDHFEYAVDPPTLKMAFALKAETSWVSTRENHVTAHFRASIPDSVGHGATASDFHVFVLRAVDDRGGISPRVVRAFYAYTVAPNVRITKPVPPAALMSIGLQVPLPFRVSWEGEDPDGEGARKPVAYRFRVLDLSDPANMVFRADPDSLWNLGNQTGWEGWRTVSGDTTSIPVTSADLALGSYGLFALVAVDAAGASTPYMVPYENLLDFQASVPASVSAPRIVITSPYYFYRDSRGYLGPIPEMPVEVAEGASMEVAWDATPAPGRELESSRWKVDGDPSDERGWSAPGPPTQRIQVPPQSPGVHRAYIEVRDDFGSAGLAIIRATAVTMSFSEDLLVVDDTRREVDRIFNGQLVTYAQPWPSAAELDTFLYARGGWPWRGARNPSDALSVPGLLAGYAFDTLGTRVLTEPANVVTLARLAPYRHVLWLVDDRGAIANGGSDPLTTLAGISGQDHLNVLAAYIAAGGEVWFAGGGTAWTSLREYGFTDVGGVSVFSSDRDQLGPGRTLYDHGHIRSSIGVAKTSAQPERSAAARGGWSGHGRDGRLAAPDYSKLPPMLAFRTAASDPIPPTRQANQGSRYYLTTAQDEVVFTPNSITESFGPTAETRHLESVLDTLYEITNPAFGASVVPAMLYYHGRENAPFLFTGFDLWSWSRADCQALVDFVLSDIWGMSRGGPRAAGVRANTGAGARSMAPRAAPQLGAARPTPRVQPRR